MAIGKSKSVSSKKATKKPPKKTSAGKSGSKAAGGDGAKKKGPKLEDYDGNGLVSKINLFVRNNAFVITLGIILSFFYFNMKLGSLADRVEDTLVKNTQYIKKNIGHPIFLSATGQVVVASKSPMSYSDPRFRQYVVNNIVDYLVMGLVRISGNYKITYTSPDSIATLNPKVKNFVEVFLGGNTAPIEDYLAGVYHAIVENRYPEYIDPYDLEVPQFVVRKNEMGGPGSYDLFGRIQLTVLTKSWIYDLKKWDTRQNVMNIPFRGVIDPSKYGDVGNPFGIRFTKIEIPVVLKPTARAVLEGAK